MKYRAKAIIAAAGLAFVGLAEYVVEQPDTGHMLEQLMPSPYAQLVPILMGGLAAMLVHAVPNTPLPAAPAPPAAAAVLEPAPVTSMVQLVQSPGGN